MLEILTSLAQPFVAIGAVLGFALGLLVAMGLHWLFPLQDLLVPQALFVAGGFIGGMLQVALSAATACPGSSLKIQRSLEAQ